MNDPCDREVNAPCDREVNDPEPQWRWHREDNDMHLIAPQCDGVHVVSTLRELGVAVDQLWRSS